MGKVVWRWEFGSGRTRWGRKRPHRVLLCRLQRLCRPRPTRFGGFETAKPQDAQEFAPQALKMTVVTQGRQGVTQFLGRSRAAGVERGVGYLSILAGHDWRTPEGNDMLVLSRKLGEKIFIGENICITVVDIDRGKIRLGIEAPRDVPIYRQELLPLAQQQEMMAAQQAQQKLPSAS